MHNKYSTKKHHSLSRSNHPMYISWRTTARVRATSWCCSGLRDVSGEKNCNPTRSAHPTPIHTKGWHVTNPTKTTHSNQSEQGEQLPVIVGFYTCQVYHVGILPIMPRSWEACWGRCCWTFGRGLWSWGWCGLACAVFAPLSQLQYHRRQQSWSGAGHCDTARPARFKFLVIAIYLSTPDIREHVCNSFVVVAANYICWISRNNSHGTVERRFLVLQYSGMMS